MSLDTDLEAVWPFDNDAGADAHNSHDLTITGGTFDATNKKVGTHSLSMDGVDDDAVVAASSEFNYGFGDSFTLIAWVKTGDTGFQRIFHKAITSSPYTGIWCGQYSNQTFYMELYGTGATYIGRRTTTTINTGSFVFVIATYDGSSASSGIKLYIGDPTSAVDTTDSENGTLAGALTNSGKMRVGSDNIAAPWEDNIDQAVIYNRVITQSERLEHWNSGSGLAYPFVSGGIPLFRRRINGE